MSETTVQTQGNPDLLYGLHDHILGKAFFGRSTACTSRLYLGDYALINHRRCFRSGEHIPYLISMALMVSGVATFIQTRKVGPVGSGLMALQGTSFGFLAAVLAAGFVVKNRGEFSTAS